MSPKAHTSFTPQRIKTNQHVQQNQTNTETAEMVWRPKRNKVQTKWSIQKGPGHHILVPSQYMGGGPQVNGFRGYGLAVERKRGSILGFQLKLLWGKMSCWDGISPKRGKCELGPLDTCHRGRKWKGLIFIRMREVKKQKEIRNKTSNFVWEWRVVQPTHSEQW